MFSPTLVPLKGFVHEVFWRSRTSGVVLQTTLRYLKAIRQKVPALAKKAKAGEGLSGEESEGRAIMSGDLPDREATGMRVSIMMSGITMCLRFPGQLNCVNSDLRKLAVNQGRVKKPFI
jgi:hypothetical protein